MIEAIAKLVRGQHLTEAEAGRAMELILSGDATPVQIALAWLLHQRVVVIPKASDPDHVRENAGAIKIALTDTDMAAIDQAFPAPRKKIPLEVK